MINATTLPQPHVAVNYMHAPDYVLQRRYIEHYVDHVLEPSRQLMMVLSVGYWVWFPEVGLLSGPCASEVSAVADTAEVHGGLAA